MCVKLRRKKDKNFDSNSIHSQSEVSSRRRIFYGLMYAAIDSMFEEVKSKPIPTNHRIHQYFSESQSTTIQSS